MRSQTLSLATLLSLVATLTISDFPLIPNLPLLGFRGKIPNQLALAQTPASQKNDVNKVSIFETQVNSYRQLLQTLVAQNKTDRALEIAQRGRARALIELLRSRLASQQRTQSVTVQQSALTPPTAEGIKRIAKEHQATLVSYSIIYDAYFSRDVENLSPCRKEALIFPPSLIGDRGIGFSWTFPHDVKSQNPSLR